MNKEEVKKMQGMSGKDIQREIQRRFSRRLLGFLMISIVYISLVFFFEKNGCFDTIPIVCESFCNSLCDIVSVMSTILAAVVVFFYSTQDNCKVGIPHRAIMLYTFGEYTVPIVFLIELVMQLVILIFLFYEMYYVSLLMIVITFILQILLIVFIILATLHEYCTYAIFNVEIRQFLLLPKLKKTLEDNDLKLVWADLLKHMKYAVESNELSNEREIFFRRLLSVPFYKKEQSMFDFWFRRSENQFVFTDEFFCEDKKWELYCFYYNNLLPVFEYLSEDSRTEERNIYYLILYGFIKDLDVQYEKNIRIKESTFLKGNYHIIISAVMNACMMSPVREKEEFCLYIFCNCLCDEARIQQIGLYVLFQEFLYKISPDKVCVKYIRNIKQYISDWKKLVTQKGADYKKIYIEHWCIWKTWISESIFFSYGNLQNALDTIFEQSFESVPIAYIMNINGRE